VTAAYSENAIKSPTSHRTRGWRRKLKPTPATIASNRQKFANVGNISVTFHECFLHFLPGFALRIESDVTHSKQTTAHFLPGATTTCPPRRDFSKNCGFNPESFSNMFCVEPAKTLRNAGARTAVSGPYDAAIY